jgi:hypothetical protein
MALTDILYGTRRAQIGALVIDADVQTVHSRSWSTTEHPVEDGASVADHRIRQPAVIKINGIVSDVPTELGFGLVTGLTSGRDENRSADAWRQLQELADSEELLTVITSLETFDDMVITDLEATRTAPTGRVLSFTATCKQILRVATAALGATPVPKSPRVKQAKKATPPASAGERASFIFNATN